MRLGLVMILLSRQLSWLSFIGDWATKKKALSALERAYAAHDLQIGFLGVDPHYDPLRSEPRFKELIRKVRLPE
jgi:hypothetical protein